MAALVMVWRLLLAVRAKQKIRNLSGHQVWCNFAPWFRKLLCMLSVKGLFREVGLLKVHWGPEYASLSISDWLIKALRYKHNPLTASPCSLEHNTTLSNLTDSCSSYILQNLGKINGNWEEFFSFNDGKGFWLLQVSVVRDNTEKCISFGRHSNTTFLLFSTVLLPTATALHPIGRDWAT